MIKKFFVYEKMYTEKDTKSRKIFFHERLTFEKVPVISPMTQKLITRHNTYEQRKTIYLIFLVYC